MCRDANQQSAKRTKSNALRPSQTMELQVNIVNIDVVDDLHVLFARAVMSKSTHGDAEELV
jgi:hypothetical protein